MVKIFWSHLQKGLTERDLKVKVREIRVKVRISRATFNLRNQAAINLPVAAANLLVGLFTSHPTTTIQIIDGKFQVIEPLSYRYLTQWQLEIFKISLSTAEILNRWFCIREKRNFSSKEFRLKHSIQEFFQFIIKDP